jgi:hypothetical protein
MPGSVWAWFRRSALTYPSSCGAWSSRLISDKPKFHGFSPENVINRLAAQGIHLEQSAETLVFHKQIAGAVANVFASPWRWMAYVLTGFLRRSPNDTA